LIGFLRKKGKTAGEPGRLPEQIEPRLRLELLEEVVTQLR
jgi:hypothetical protein